MDEDEPGLVRAARDGDRTAARDLLRRHLPLVHDLLTRALIDPDEAVEVCVEVAEQALADLTDPNSSGRLRGRLLRITVQQIADHVRRRGTEIPNKTGIYEQTGVGLTDPSEDRRDLLRAGGWLDQRHRTLFALWWQECAGRITRTEVATALELGEANTALALQRMREQLEHCRTAVAALDRAPRCSGLAGVCDGWTGSRDPLWRKRITEHVRSCVVCLREAQELPSAARVPAGAELAAVPTQLFDTLARRGLLEPTERPDPPEDLAERAYVEEEVGAWGRIRWVGRVVTVTSVATLLLLVVGLLYDVSQTPPTRTENPSGATALSAALATGTEGWTIRAGQVADPDSGLVWQRGRSAPMSGQEASGYCSELDLGAQEWRLPSIEELQSLVDDSRSAPALDTDAFPQTPAHGWFWSASRVAGASDNRWALAVEDGSTGHDVQSGYVRCVRTG